MTKAELKAQLDELGVEYTSRAKKSELVELVEKAQGTIEQLDDIVDFVEVSLERRLGYNVSEGWAIALMVVALLGFLYLGS
ncbi:HeH/LEM domain-containing protein [Alphaproteobacteria bacterium]|nr:HeH/LEM domain-containing protein [Alphaproteobacteria bacterium]